MRVAATFLAVLSAVSTSYGQEESKAPKTRATVEAIWAGDDREEPRADELTAEDYVTFMMPLVGSWKSTVAPRASSKNFARVC